MNFKGLQGTLRNFNELQGTFKELSRDFKGLLRLTNFVIMIWAWSFCALVFVELLLVPGLDTLLHGVVSAVFFEPSFL